MEGKRLVVVVVSIQAIKVDILVIKVDIQVIKVDSLVIKVGRQVIKVGILHSLVVKGDMLVAIKEDRLVVVMVGIRRIQVRVVIDSLQRQVQR